MIDFLTNVTGTVDFSVVIGFFVWNAIHFHLLFYINKQSIVANCQVLTSALWLTSPQKKFNHQSFRHLVSMLIRNLTAAFKNGLWRSQLSVVIVLRCLPIEIQRRDTNAFIQVKNRIHATFAKNALQTEAHCGNILVCILAKNRLLAKAVAYRFDGERVCCRTCARLSFLKSPMAKQVGLNFCSVSDIVVRGTWCAYLLEELKVTCRTVFFHA